MEQDKPIIESAEDTKDVLHHNRLMSLLKELVREEGIMEAARVLDVDYKTLARSMKEGRLFKKMCWAVERLQHGESAAAIEHWHSTAKLKDSLGELEEELRSGLARLSSALDRQREEHVRHQRRVERQLAALVLGNAVTAPEDPGIEEDRTDESEAAGTSSGPPWWRPGKAVEDRVIAMVDEWWRARNWLIAAEERVNIAMGWDIFTDPFAHGENAEAPVQTRASRRGLLSKRNRAHSEPIEYNVAEAGYGQGHAVDGDRRVQRVGQDMTDPGQRT